MIIQLCCNDGYDDGGSDEYCEDDIDDDGGSDEHCEDDVDGDGDDQDRRPHGVRGRRGRHLCRSKLSCCFQYQAYTRTATGPS